MVILELVGAGGIDMLFIFILLFVGSKTPTSKFRWSKEVRWKPCCP